MLWTVLAWVIWLASLAASGLACVFFFAFADDPTYAKAVVGALPYTAGWFLVCIVVGGPLLAGGRSFGRTALACLLALTPPVVAFLTARMLGAR